MAMGWIFCLGSCSRGWVFDRDIVGYGLLCSDLQEMGLPLLFTAILLYYAIKLLVFSDVVAMFVYQQRFSFVQMS